MKKRKKARSYSEYNEFIEKHRAAILYAIQQDPKETDKDFMEIVDDYERHQNRA